MADSIYRIDQDLCVQCGTCAEQCPAEAIIQGKVGRWEGKYRISLKKCLSCGSCADVCPVGGITFVEKKAQDDKDEEEFA